ncbi:type I-E CRISPR-associated protein Cas6/Cse3/CasE [Streptomyces sp. NPDC020965]|uniref:type I-E CRISPR-associated protein Cas6/Cse3/CasE n=1 Tax=Streptomyces sp. NPDC020965 TaxID=3365105 RepID=UPI0037B08813
MNAPTLTRLTLNPRHGAVRADLADAVSLHKTLMRLVPDNLGSTPRATAGLLFRLETTHEPIVLIQTATQPDLAALPHQYGTAHTKTLTAMFQALRPGITAHYRITAAPTIDRSAGTPHPHPVTGKRRGKTTPLTGPAALQWWQRRAQTAGLDVLTCHTTPRPFPRQDRTRPGPFHKLTQFEGIARVTNTDLLTSALRGGIGKGKTYGAGLLSLSPT